MDIKQQFENLIKSAELYESQGLYQEARKAYTDASKLVESAPHAKNKEDLLSSISKKIDVLNTKSSHIESAPSSHELPDNVQDLIKNLFSFPEKENPDARALAEAVTLAKFGQMDRAIQELYPLLDKKVVGVVAAKNIIRCHVLMDNDNKAVTEFDRWMSQNTFTFKELDSIRNLLETLLIKKGTQKPLPKITIESPTEPPPTNLPAEDPKEMLDIGSVLINFDQGPLKGKPVEFDVNFQTGNTVSLLIESQEKNLLDTLSIGFRLTEVQYRSSVAIFRGAGVVSAKIMIHEGPKRGDYHLDIKVQDH